MLALGKPVGKPVDYSNKEEVDRILKEVMTEEYPDNPLELLGELDFKEPEHVPVDRIGTEVQEFYRDATVFVTGFTGFVGKALVEKLLRSIPHIKQVYVLIRSKKGHSAEERMHEVLSDRMFNRLKHEVPWYQQKLTPVNGDLNLQNCGLSREWADRLANEVDVVFHSGASVRLYENLRSNATTNLLGTIEMVNLAKRITKLKAFIYISTAYSNCPNNVIEEKVYPPAADFKDIIKLLEDVKDEEILEQITPKILKDWPNTYTFSKNLAEHVLKTEGSTLPIGIVRPSVVIASYNEPVRGWVDNVNGPAGVSLAAGIAFLRVWPMPLHIRMDIVPVDAVANLTICAPIGLQNQFQVKNHNGTNHWNESSPLVFNCCSSRYTLRDLMLPMAVYGLKYPSIKCMWYYSILFDVPQILEKPLTFVLHDVLGYISDIALRLSGRKPVFSKTYKMLRKVRKSLSYFIYKEWTFRTDNLERLWRHLSQEDKELFFFDVKNMSLDKWHKTAILGLRVYLLKEDINTLPAARRRYKRLYYLHQTTKTLFWAFVLYVLWKTISLIFNLF